MKAGVYSDLSWQRPARGTPGEPSPRGSSPRFLPSSAIGMLLGDSLTTEGRPTNDPESERAIDAMCRAFPPRPRAADDRRRRHPLRPAHGRLARVPRLRRPPARRRATRRRSPTRRTYLDDPSTALVSDDRHATLVSARDPRRRRIRRTSSTRSRLRTRTPPSRSRSPATERSTTTSTCSRRRTSRRASSSSGCRRR